MQLNPEAEARALLTLPLPALQARYAEVTGESPRSSNRQYLVRRTVWKMQARLEGDLSERARRRAAELADDTELRRRAPATKGPPVIEAVFRPKPRGVAPAGSLLTRHYQGRELVVKVLDRGFEFDGVVYRSLSAVANKVTGGHWNGRQFFGIAQEKKA